MRALGFRLALTRVLEMGDMGDRLAERGLKVGEVKPVPLSRIAISTFGPRSRVEALIVGS
jgi:hypothetical protein